jgi:hypothetical protein
VRPEHAVGLDVIVDRHPAEYDQEDRVVSFEPDGDKLVVREACDDYFSLALDKAEVQRLIDWLTNWIKQA